MTNEQLKASHLTMAECMMADPEFLLERENQGGNCLYKIENRQLWYREANDDWKTLVSKSFYDEEEAELAKVLADIVGLTSYNTKFLDPNNTFAAVVAKIVLTPEEVGARLFAGEKVLEDRSNLDALPRVIYMSPDGRLQAVHEKDIDQKQYNVSYDVYFAFDTVKYHPYIEKKQRVDTPLDIVRDFVAIVRQPHQSLPVNIKAVMRLSERAIKVLEAVNE